MDWWLRGALVARAPFFCARGCGPVNSRALPAPSHGADVPRCWGLSGLVRRTAAKQNRSLCTIRIRVRAAVALSVAIAGYMPALFQAQAANQVCHSRACHVRVIAKQARADAHWCNRHAACRKRVAIREEIRQLTPYRGPDGTRYAIPWRIIRCESGGSWTAANPSGAIGVYQLLGKGVPWPADTERKRLEHHRVAAALWAGGGGAHHWQQCL